MEYIYSTEDRLLTPHKYMYTPYDGNSFLRAYFKDRISKTLLFQTNIDELLTFLSEYLIDNQIVKQTKSLNIDTIEVLSDLLLTLLKERSTISIDPKFEILVKKYEVSKKLFTSYTIDWKKQQTDQEELPYILLHFACLLHYTKFENLKMLNCALKLGDLLSSRFLKLENQELVKNGLQLEIEAIRGLMDKHGVFL